MGNKATTEKKFLTDEEIMEEQNKVPAVMQGYKVLEILKTTDEEHPITYSEISRRIGCKREKVPVIIDTMTAELNVLITEKKNEKGTFQGVFLERGDEKFNSDEIRLLADSVISNRYISSSETRKLLKKLSELLPSKEKISFSRINVFDEKTKTDHEETIKNVGILSKAIEAKRQVKFSYCTYNRVKKLVVAGEYQVSPYQLIYANGFYMLLCIMDDNSVRSFRIDMMKDVKKLDKVYAKIADTYNKPEMEGTVYIEGHPYMKLGEIEWIDILIYEDEIGRAIDTFGKNIKIADAEDGMLRASFKANTEDVYLWALQNADVAAVIFPQPLRDRLRRTSATMNNVYHMYAQDHMSANYDAIVGKTKIRLAKYFSRPRLLMGDTPVRRRLQQEHTQDKVRYIVINHFDDDVREEMKEYINVSKIIIPSFNEDYDGEQKMTDLNFLAPLKNIEKIEISREELTDISALFEMKKLTNISIHASITKEDMDKLKATFPDAEIDIW